MYRARVSQRAAYFRQAFAVPAADSYAASAIVFGIFTNKFLYKPTNSSLFINQQEFTATSYASATA